jgi:hypothetical protein
MHRIRARSHPAERATTTLEYVGIAIAAAVLLAGAGVAMGARGEAIGARVVQHVQRLAAGERVALRWRGAQEARTGGGSVRVRVSRDELRLRPVVDPLALWSGSWEREGELGAGVHGQVRASACAACAAAEWSRELALGAFNGDGAGSGLRGELAAAVRAAAVSGQLDARVERRFDDHARLFGTGRTRVTVGGEADGSVRGHVDRATLDIEAEGTAVAGAVARGEVQVGLDVLGVAIRQGARAEGWAGAGIRGVAGVTRTGGVVSWRLGWGGALGLGGAAEVAGSVDVSRVPERHRRIATTTLAAAIGAATGLPLDRVLAIHD